MAEKLRVEAFTVGPLDNNSYLVVAPDDRRVLVVDPSMDSEPIADRIDELGATVDAVVNTHGHFDHIFNNALFAKQFNAPVMIHEGDLQMLRDMKVHANHFGFESANSPEPESFLREDTPVKVDGFELQVLFTPGHSPGGVCLLGEDFVLTGDTLFAGSIGRTDLPGGDFETLTHSIREKLYKLPDDIRVFPGHGPPSTIGQEKRSNYFVRGDG